MAKFISLFMVPDNKLIYVNPDYIKCFRTTEIPVNEGHTSLLKSIEVTILDIRDHCEVRVKETPEEILDKLNNFWWIPNNDGLSGPGKLP